MDIGQIGLFVVGWFAVGFLVALALGKILREANEPDRLEPHVSLVVSEAFNMPAGRRTQGQHVSNKKRAKSNAASL
jgi:hypothetical protein